MYKPVLITLICLIFNLYSSESNIIFRNKRAADGSAKQWGYRNEDKSILPQDWHKHHKKCYGRRQSPINVESASTLYNESLAQIDINQIKVGGNSGNNNEKWQIKNNGHSVVLTPLDNQFSFVMSPEKSQYKLLQMHFHWRGSEHYVDGHKFSAELHLVHQNIADANKFAVLGFFLSVTNKDNEYLRPIINGLRNVIKFNKESTIEMFKLHELVPFTVKDYYRYAGSLTTPECDEVVEWFVVDNPVLEISEDQMIDLQALEDKNGYPILTNVRPIQEINERLVKRSFKQLKSNNNRRHFKSASGHTEVLSSTQTKYTFSLLMSSLSSMVFLVLATKCF